MARIEAGELSSFLQKLARYDCEPQTRYAIEFVMHTFVRTNELRFGKWSEKAYPFDSGDYHMLC